MRNFLESQITSKAFSECWDDSPPPYESFVEEIAKKLSKDLRGRVKELSASIRPSGENRVRVDGEFTTDKGSKTFYVELVWLPSSSSYRGKSKVREKLPNPSPKSIDQFISILDAISDDEEVTFEGQVFKATDGVDESSNDLSVAFTSIFSLFERFPEEGFGNPGILVHMLEANGEYEVELADSLKRKPSIPAVTLVNRILNGELPNADRVRWMTALHDAATANTTETDVKDWAQELLQYQQKR